MPRLTPQKAVLSLVCSIHLVLFVTCLSDITDKMDETTTLTTSTASQGSLKEPEDKPWYMIDGHLRPKKGEQKPRVWPEESPTKDRIHDQLMYVPDSVPDNQGDAEPDSVPDNQGDAVPDSVPDNQGDAEAPLKKILLWNGIRSWGDWKAGRGSFLKERCPVSTCILTSDTREAENVDLILFKNHFSSPVFRRPNDQIWMLYLLESPHHTQNFTFKNVFNWTATYRRDSTVVAPYAKWRHYDSTVKTKKQDKNYAANKTKQVAWFVSNCKDKNGRLTYAWELSKYINVDIYGACGTKNGRGLASLSIRNSSVESVHCSMMWSGEMRSTEVYMMWTIGGEKESVNKKSARIIENPKKSQPE